MNLSQAKESTLQLLDKFSMYGIIASKLDTADLNNRMNYLANSSQMEIARIKKIKASKTIIQTGEDVEGYNFYNLPFDFFELINITFGDNLFLNFSIEENKIKILKVYDGTFVIHYYKNPEEITSSTPDSYEFEIDYNSQSLIPTYIASMLLLIDNKNVSDRLYDEYLFKLKSLPKNSDNGGINTVINVTGW